MGRADMTGVSKIVSDTGPLISWARAHQLELLRTLVQQLILPRAVVQELKKPNRSGSALLGESWIVQAQPLPGGTVLNFPQVLGEGERQAIATASLLGALLLVDDISARREAERRGIACLSTLRLLAQAKTDGLVTQVAPLLQTFRAQGFWLSDSVTQRFLMGLGEA